MIDGKSHDLDDMKALRGSVCLLSVRRDRFGLIFARRPNNHRRGVSLILLVATG